MRCPVSNALQCSPNILINLLYCEPQHWACDEMISLTGLTDHVIGAECGDNYMRQPLPYQEEIEYTRALDDQHGNSFWRPSLLQFGNGITFYLQVIKVNLIQPESLTVF